MVSTDVFTPETREELSLRFKGVSAKLETRELESILPLKINKLITELGLSSTEVKDFIEKRSDYDWLQKVVSTEDIHIYEGVQRKSFEELALLKKEQAKRSLKNNSFRRIFDKVFSIVKPNEEKTKPHEHVQRRELPTISVQFTLEEMLTALLSKEQKKTFLREFSEKTKLRNTSVSVSVLLTDELKNLPHSEKLKKIAAIMKNASDVLIADHGWTGDKSIWEGEQINSFGQVEQVVLAGAWLYTLPRNRAQNAFTISVDLLGQGSAKFVEGVTSFGQEDNAKAWAFIHSILGTINPQRQAANIGHSMGAGTSINGLANYLNDIHMNVLPTCVSYNNPEKDIDGNQWNNPESRKLMRKAVSLLIGGVSTKLKEVLGNVVPYYSLIERSVAEIIVKLFFLKGLDRTDIIEKHIINFINDSKAAEITANGSLKQKGITDEQWIEIAKKHSIILWGFEGDEMCIQKMIAMNLPKVQQFLEEGVSPIPYYVFPKGNHYSQAEAEQEEKVQDLLSMIDMNPTLFKLFTKAQYAYYIERKTPLKSENKRLTFYDFAKLYFQMNATYFAEQLNLSTEQIKNYIEKRSKNSDKDILSIYRQTFTRGVVIRVLAEKDGPTNDEIPQGLETLEKILKVLQNYTDHLVYHDDSNEALARKQYNFSKLGHKLRHAA